METRIHARVIIKILLDFWYSGRPYFTRDDMDSIICQLLIQTEEGKDEV